MAACSRGVRRARSSISPARLPALLLRTSFLVVARASEFNSLLPRIRLKTVKPVDAVSTVRLARAAYSAGENVPQQTVMGLPSGLDSRHQLQYGLQCRRFSLACGAGAQRSPRSPDFKHKVTRKALWIDSWSTPAWVKVRLESATPGRLQPHAGYGTKASQDIAQGNRLPKDNNGKGNVVPTSARERRQTVLYKVVVAVCTCKEPIRRVKPLLF